MSILIPTVAEPAFETAQEQSRVWGRHWGCDSDIGSLKLVLMQPPLESTLLADPCSGGKKSDLSTDKSDVGWYWEKGECLPRNELPFKEMKQQWGQLVEVLSHEGVEVVLMEDVSGGRYSHYTRDSSIAVKGGAIICRLAPDTRRGEESWTTKSLANLGMPIIRTINGAGLMEGGSFAWLNSDTAIIGRSNCVNEEGVAQIEEVLSRQGAEVIRVDLSMYEIHLDGVFNMVGRDLAIVDVNRVPFSFLEELNRRKINLIPTTVEDNRWIVNCLAINPRKVLMPEGLSEGTRKKFDDFDVEIITVPFDKVQQNGGGIRCSTCPLIRESVT